MKQIQILLVLGMACLSGTAMFAQGGRPDGGGGLGGLHRQQQQQRSTTPLPPPPPLGVNSDDGMTKVITFASKDEWSGEGKAFSDWYTFKTPPAPEGYVVVKAEPRLVGDRNCGAFAECRSLQTLEDGSVSVQFRMQGHDDSLPSIVIKKAYWNSDANGPSIDVQVSGRKATSRMVVTVTYRKR